MTTDNDQSPRAGDGKSLTLPYSIDLDPAGIRALVSDAICGALALGAQNESPAPEGHWLAHFWQLGRQHDEWRATVWAVARALDCLPSTFSDANGHVLRAAERLMAERTAAPAAAPAAVPMCSEQAVLHALTMARGEAHQQGDAALWQAFGRAMWRQFNAMRGAQAGQWTVSIAGPDDVHRFDSELDALRFANQVNRTYLADLLAHPGNEVLCLATVTDASPPLSPSPATGDAQ